MRLSVACAVAALSLSLAGAATNNTGPTYNKDMKVNTYPPDGSVKPLIYTSDNSSSNPRNPSKPPIRVVHGEETINEMGLAFLSMAPPTPADAIAFQRAVYMSARQ